MTTFDMQKLLERMQISTMTSSESGDVLEVPLINLYHDDAEARRGTRSETTRTLTAQDVRTRILSGTDWTKESCIPFQLMFESMDDIMKLAKNGGNIRPLGQFLESVRRTGSPTTGSGAADNPFVQAGLQGQWVLQDNQFGTQQEALTLAILISYVYCQVRSQVTSRIWNGIPFTHLTAIVHRVICSSVHDNVFINIWKYAQASSLVQVLAPEEYGCRHGAWPQDPEGSTEDALYCWLFETVFTAIHQLIECFISEMKDTASKHLNKLSLVSGEDVVCIDMDRAITQAEARTLYSKLGLESLWHYENRELGPRSNTVSRLESETRQNLIHMYTSPCVEMIFLEGCRFWGSDTIFDANKTAEALPSSAIVFAAAVADRLLLAICAGTAVPAGTGHQLVERATMTRELSLAWKVHRQVITALVFERRPPTKDGKASPSTLGLFLARVIKRLDIPSQPTVPGPPVTTLTPHEMLFHLHAMSNCGAAPVAAQVPDLLDALVAAGTATNDNEDRDGAASAVI